MAILPAPDPLTSRPVPPDASSAFRWSQFFEATRAIFSVQNPERLPELIVDATARAMEADSVSLLLPHADGTLRVAHASGIPLDVQRSTRVIIGQGIAGCVAASLTPLILNGAVSHGHGRSKSAIIYPLVSAGQVAGVLNINRIGGERLFIEQDLESAEVLASLILMALGNLRLIRQSTDAEKLAAVGQLAAGIAHEINTPIQFVGDSVHFAHEAMTDLIRLVESYRNICQAARAGAPVEAALAQVLDLEEEVDLAYLIEQGPKALERGTEGLRRVAEIVQAVKSFSRTEAREKRMANVNELLQTTSVMARPEYKHVAELELDAGELELLLCHPNDLNQVFLNLIVNAGHAISDVVARTGQRGLITVRTRRIGQEVVVEISDTGAGIPAAARDRIFDPFFTTKPVGKGTGLGLAIARTIIVDKHGGTLTFDSVAGKGTSFWVRLPIDAPPEAPSS